MAEKFSVQAVFTAVDHFSGPVARMSDSLNKFNSTSSMKGGGPGGNLTRGANEVNAAWGRMNQRFSSLNSKMVMTGVVGGYMAKRLVTAGADVESALLQGSAKFGDGIRRNTPAFKELEQAAFDLGRTTRFGAVEAAGALNELAASGFDPSAAMKNLPIVAKMAIAGSEDLQTATTMALDSMGVFGMLYDEMGNLRGPNQLATNLTRVADVMAYTANQTTASMGSIYETLTEAGKITDVAGMTFEKFAAITGSLAQAGIKGSVAGTAIKNITVRLLSPTSEGSTELRKLKIDERSFRKMSDPLQQLEVISDAIGKLPKDDKVKALDEYFGKIPLAAASFLASGGFRNARVLEEKNMKFAPGSNERQAAIMGDSTKDKMAMLENSFERVGKTVFNEIQKPLEETMTRLTKWLDNNETRIGGQAGRAMDWLLKHGEEIGTAAEYAAKGWLAITGAKVLHSGVTFIKDIGAIAAGVGTLFGKMGAANASLKALTMGRVGLTAAGGVAGGAALATTGGAMLLNEQLKDTTEGMGIVDILFMQLYRAINGGSMNAADIVDDHRNKLAHGRYLDDIKRNKMAAADGPLTAYDEALANSQYGDLTTDPTGPTLKQLADAMQVDPIVIPPESITVKPIDVQAVFDAIAAQIAASGPSVVGTADKNAGASQDFSDAYSRTDLNVSVEAMPGTKARTTQTTHTKPNNHRTGTP